jgi:hypothetical protein
MVAITRGKSIVRAEISGPDDRRAVIELPIDVN